MAKQTELTMFMVQWHSKMGQQYDETYDAKTADHLDFKLAEQIQNDDMNWKIEFNGVWQMWSGMLMERHQVIIK